jgi:predicted nicotinamide N-methyase
MIPHLKRNIAINDIDLLNKKKRLISSSKSSSNGGGSGGGGGGRKNRNTASSATAEPIAERKINFVQVAPLQWGEPIQLQDLPPWCLTPQPVNQEEVFIQAAVSNSNNDSGANVIVSSQSNPPLNSEKDHKVDPLETLSNNSQQQQLLHDNRIYFSLVLCADLAYNEEVVEDLLDTLIKVTSPNTLVLFSMELRTAPVLEDLLVKLLRSGFTMTRISRDCFHPDYNVKSVIVYALRRKDYSSLVTEGADTAAMKQGLIEFEEGFLRVSPPP